MAPESRIVSWSEAATQLPWLAALVKTKFHDPCPIHGGSKCHLRNQFCTKCMGNPFCFQCRKEDTKHEDHLVLRARRASGHATILVDDINNLLDTSDIKEFNINGMKIYHLYSRQTKKRTGSSPKGFCKICNWELKTEDFFCSIGCKLVASQEKKVELVASQGEERDRIQCASAIIASEEMELPEPKRPCIRYTTNKLHDRQGIKRDAALAAKSSNKSLRRRSRKGTPHRSPFF